MTRPNEDKFPTPETQQAERERLFKIIGELVEWENSGNEEIFANALAEIKKSVGKDLPAVFDPFAGGGTIPLEAQRLGLKAYASDLNPVAVMINKAMIELPAKFKNQPPVNPIADRLIGGYRGSFVFGAYKYFGLRVERTFAWLNHSRRLSKDYELTAASSETLTKFGLIIENVIDSYVNDTTVNHILLMQPVFLILFHFKIITVGASDQLHCFRL